MPHRSRAFPLAELALFADITKAQHATARRLLTPVTVEAGTQLMREGGVGNEVFIVADGLVEVTRGDGDESEVLAVVGGGDILGEMSVLHGGRRSATATTLVPTLVYAATPREFFALMEAVPSARQRIVDAAATRVRANMAA